MNDDAFYDMQLRNWAAEVAREESCKDVKPYRESTVIDSSRTIKRQSDPFYKTHVFVRK